MQIISYLHIHLATFTKTNLKFLMLTLRTEDVLRILTLRTEYVLRILTLRTEDVLKKGAGPGFELETSCLLDALYTTRL